MCAAYPLRKNVKKRQGSCTILYMFYKAMVESVMSFCITCWFGNASGKDRSKINQIVRTAFKMSVKPTAVEDLFLNFCRNVTEKIIKDQKHPLPYVLFRSGKRLNVMYQRTSRFKNLFVSQSIKSFSSVFNSF